MVLNLETILTRNTEAAAAPIDDELVILNMKGNNYLTLDAIGRRIWELLEGPVRVGDLCRRLAAEYAGEPARIEADVLAFLARLMEDGLVHGVDS